MKRGFAIFLTLLMVFALSPIAQAAETGDVNFGVSVSKRQDSIEVTVSGDNAAAIAQLEKDGCRMEISVPCEFATAYTVRDSKLVDSKLDSASQKMRITAVGSGTYTVVNGAPPVVEMDTAGKNAKEITVSENNARFLQEMTVSCGYSGAEVYCNGKKVASTLSGGKLTFGVDEAGTYEIREVTQSPTTPTPPTTPTAPAATTPSGSSGGSASGSTTGNPKKSPAAATTAGGKQKSTGNKAEKKAEKPDETTAKRETQPATDKTDETQPAVGETQAQTVPQQTAEKRSAKGGLLWLPMAIAILLLLVLLLLVIRKYRNRT